MKEPYEIYVDEFIREVRRRSKPSAEGLGHPRELSKEQLQEAEFAAAEATAYHLVDQLGFHPHEAEDVIEAFRAAASLDREKLKGVWTDIVLRHGHSR